MAIVDLLETIGVGYNNLIKSDSALYGLYFTAFCFALYVIYYTALNLVPHLKGKPAKVISSMLTIISVGSIFYGKGINELVTLFHSSTWLIVIVIVVIIVIGGAVFLANNYSNPKEPLYWIIISLGVFVGSSILQEPFKKVFKSTTGISAGMVEFIGHISNVSLLVFAISLIVLLLSVISFGNSSKATKDSNPELAELRNDMESIDKEVVKVDDFFRSMDDFLTHKKIN